MRPRISLLSLLLVLSAASVLLFARLQPFYAAHEFADLANAEGVPGAFVELPDNLRSDFDTWFSPAHSHYPAGNEVHVESSPLAVLQTGRCQLSFPVENSAFNFCGTVVVTLRFDWRESATFSLDGIALSSDCQGVY